MIDFKGGTLWNVDDREGVLLNELGMVTRDLSGGGGSSGDPGTGGGSGAVGGGFAHHTNRPPGIATQVRSRRGGTARINNLGPGNVGGN